MRWRRMRKPSGVPPSGRKEKGVCACARYAAARAGGLACPRARVARSDALNIRRVSSSSSRFLPRLKRDEARPSTPQSGTRTK